MTDADEKRKKRVGTYVIANAIVWGAVIIATSLVLRDAGLMGKMLPILGGGSAFSVVVLTPLLLEKKK